MVIAGSYMDINIWYETRLRDTDIFISCLGSINNKLKTTITSRTLKVGISSRGHKPHQYGTQNGHPKHSRL